MSLSTHRERDPGDALRYGRPSPLDSLLYHDPSMVIGALLHFRGTPPPLQALTEHVLQRLDQVPPLSLAMKGRGLQARWHRVRPEVGHHIRSQTVPAGRSTHDVVRELARAPFAPGEPLWDLTLLHADAPDRYAVLYRVSHGLQDGGGFIHTLETLFSPTTIPRDQCSAAIRHLSDPPRPILRQKAAAARVIAQASTKTGLWPHPEHGHSTERTFRWAAVPSHLLRALTRPLAGTCNDAYIATLGYTLLRWTAQHHPSPTDGIPLSVAISTRSTATLDAPGNHVSAGRFTLPGTGTPLPQYLRTTVHATALLKSSPHREAVRRIASGTPPWLVQKSFKTLLSPQRASVFCSNLTVRNPLSFRTDPVTAIDPLTAISPGSPASILLITYQDRSSALFITDSALPDMDMLHERWRDTLHRAASTDPPAA
ncbi:wax ester/triacylglycerol synthase domain-containing protein [Streptomyces sp. V3I7]|uniref:wax ester/triacylglycerol synthase domain-containing protein n=1 Tax=Streptomyces sp. V3I7 TaxID=3042278 RepID=UPI00278775B2|nr:wax ester/triacylglycerol synthase domain-containing protein [Streptomyces sp. V3I7]MDQ0994040.1 diacylglycerol O-acyltransferase [Streptomyces sp. V3I7]